MLFFRFASARIILALALAFATSSASAVKCGDTIKKKTVLKKDLTCNCPGSSSDYEYGFAALTVEGPATLDLNGHTVSCSAGVGDLSFCIQINGTGAKIQNGTVSKCYVGVGGSSFQGALIKDIIAKETAGGFGLFDDSKDNTLLDVTSQDSEIVGIFVGGGDNNRVNGSYVANSLINGIFINGTNNKVISTTVEDVFFSCVYLEVGGARNVIQKNTFRRCGYTGILTYATQSIVAGNKFFSTGAASIYAVSNGDKITGNRITGSGADGIVLDGGKMVVVARNVIVNSSGDGISISSFFIQNKRCRVQDNTVKKCGEVGIRIEGDFHNITGNKITSCKAGIEASVGADKNRLIKNNVTQSTGKFDLIDLSGSTSSRCGTNVWMGNIGKGNFPCTTKK